MIFLFIVVVVRSRVAIFFFRTVFRQIISFILYVVPHGLAGIVFIAFFVIVLIVVFFFNVCVCVRLDLSIVRLTVVRLLVFVGAIQACLAGAPRRGGSIGPRSVAASPSAARSATSRHRACFKEGAPIAQAGLQRGAECYRFAACAQSLQTPSRSSSAY